MFESLNSPSALSGAKPQVAHGDVIQGQAAFDSREDTSALTNRLSRMDAHNRPHRSSKTLSGYEPVGSGPTYHEEVNGSSSKSQNEVGMVYGATSGLNDDTNTSAALSVNIPNGAGGYPQGYETSLPLNEMAGPNADFRPQADLNPEKSRPVSAHRGQEAESIFNPDPTENSSDESWQGSGRESQPAGVVSRTGLSGAALPQPETKIDFIVEQEKYEPANVNSVQPSDGLSEGAGNAVFSPRAMGEQDKEEGYLDVEELSGKVSIPAEVSQLTDSPKTIGNRQYSATLPTETHRSEPTEKIDPQGERSLHNSTAALLAQSKAVTKDSFGQGKAVTRNISEKKETAPLRNIVNDILTNDMDSGPLPRSSAAEAGPEKNLTKIAARAQPTPAQTQRLNNNPISDNNVRHTPKTAYGTSVTAPKAPEVRIGQIDVFIEAPHRSPNRRPSPPPASPSLASRHYLRRL
jgi:hypothetical protein